MNVSGTLLAHSIDREARKQVEDNNPGLEIAHLQAFSVHVSGETFLAGY